MAVENDIQISELGGCLVSLAGTDFSINLNFSSSIIDYFLIDTIFISLILSIRPLSVRLPSLPRSEVPNARDRDAGRNGTALQHGQLCICGRTPLRPRNRASTDQNRGERHSDRLGEI